MRNWPTALILIGLNGLPSWGAEKALVEISSEPPGASVQIDGRDFGKTPVRLVDQITQGPHVLKLELSGHEKFEKKLSISSMLKLNLRLRPSMGTRRIPKAPTQVAPQIQPPPAPAPPPVISPTPGEPEPPPTPFISAGARLAWQSKTFAEKPAASFLTFNLTLERRLLRRVGLRLGLGGSLHSNVEVPAVLAQTDMFATGGGFQTFAELPLHFLQRSFHSIFLEPGLGWLYHRYKYFKADADVDAPPSDTVGVHQNWLALHLGYEYAPNLGRAETAWGVCAKAGILKFSSPGDFTGQLSYSVSFGFLLLIN